MDINYANMTVFFQDLSTQFVDGMNGQRENLIVNKVAMTVPSTGAQAVHAWLNQIPQIREWVGDRLVNNIQSNKLTVVNRKFESTIEVTREEIEDDMHGMYRNLAKNMGANAEAFKDELLIEALVRGTTDTWADSVAVFSDTRTYGSSTIDNYSTTAFDAAGAGFNTAYTGMTSYKGHNGKPLMVIPKFLLHGPALRANAVAVIDQPSGALLAQDGTSYVQGLKNPNFGLVSRVESPYLIDGYVDSKGTSHDAANYWFLIGEVAGVRALAYQDRMKPEVQSSRLDNNSDYVFETDKYQFGTRMRGAGFVTMPHLVFGNFAT